MPAKGDRGAEREVPLGGARNSAVLGKEGGPGGESDRAIVARKPGNSGGAKGPAFWRASEAEEGQAIDMSLKTPERSEICRRSFISKRSRSRTSASISSGTWDKVWRADILEHAYRVAKANRGAAGVDGVTFQQIESQGREEWLGSLREDLRSKSCRPQPVRRVMIPKPGGGQRPLGIPTIRDRVAQTAVKLVIELIFEADLDPEAYGYRPKRSALDAIRRVHKLLCEGCTDVVDADLSKYFDTIPRAELLQCVARRISDRQVLNVIKRWRKTPAEERDAKGKRRMTGPSFTKPIFWASRSTSTNSLENVSRCCCRKRLMVRKSGRLPAASRRRATSSISVAAILRDEKTPVA